MQIFPEGKMYLNLTLQKNELSQIYIYIYLDQGQDSSKDSIVYIAIYLSSHAFWT